MSAVPDAAVESTLAKCLYGNPAKILEDIAQVQAVYKNLHLFVDRFCYNAQVQKWLVNLSGTVPVMYKDHLYNLPLCIWLHTAHPWVYPKCFVKLPANMVILPGKHVDQSGDLVLNYLQNWKYPSSNLLGLVQEIISVFQQQPPVYAVMNPNYNVVHNPPSGGVNSSYGVYIPAASASSQTEVICENTKNINLCQNNLEVGVTVVGETDGQSSKKNLISLNCADDKNVHSYVKELLDNGIIFEAPVQPASTLPPSTQQPEIPVAQNIIVQKDHAAPVQDQNFHRAANKCEAKETAEIFKMLTSSPFELPDEKYWIFHLLINIEERHFSLEEAAEAAWSSIDFDSALRYLSHECPICNEQVSFNKIITMTHCSCAFCEKCFKVHFTTVIKEKSISHVVCPLCSNPDLKKDGNKEDVMEYFNLLDTQIRHYLDPEVHELFQSKLRDKTLMDMPNFRWCANCSFGLLHEASRLRMDCPSCGKSTCFQCRTPWEKQHEGISCEQFKTWKLQNHPEYQANRLARYLSMHGIECPSCGFQFDLSKGGCLHFICSQCQHEFCGGCKRPFKMDSACGFSRECHAKGLHAHHPRNCFYYLRDWDIKRLQQLLNHNRIPYRGSVREGSQMHAEGLCRVLEYKETIHGLTEEQCEQIAPAEYDGLCIKHYKEYLGELINKHAVDPVLLYSKEEMLSELQRWRATIPVLLQGGTEENYVEKLRKKIIAEIRINSGQAVPSSSELYVTSSTEQSAVWSHWQPFFTSS